jgi:WD40 repeat protein
MKINNQTKNITDGPIITKTRYPGRPKTKADMLAQKLSSNSARRGTKFFPQDTKILPVDGSKESKAYWTGLRSVIGLGYGGGRIGSSHILATALSRPAGSSLSSVSHISGNEEDNNEDEEFGNFSNTSEEISSITKTESKSKNSDAAAAAQAAAVLASASGATRIVHGNDGVSSIIVPNKKPDSTKNINSDEKNGISDSFGSTKTAANLAAIAKLRTVPDYFIVGHFSPVLSLALSSDGKILASGGLDNFVRLWDPYGIDGTASIITKKAKLSGNGHIAPPVGINTENFVGHRDAITCLAFRNGTHTLYSGSADRSIKIWDCDDLAYVDTLFGHQASITSMSVPQSTSKERLFTAGADRSVRLWKVGEQSQLIFRAPTEHIFTDSVAVINDAWFVSGGTDGALSLWHVAKKHPVYTRPDSHGKNKTENEKLLTGPSSSCAWISAIAYCPGSDIFVSGAGDGTIRFWRLVTEKELSVEKNEDENDSNDSVELRRISRLKDIRLSLMEAVRPTAFRGILPLTDPIDIRGFVNGLSFSSDGRLLVAAIGQEHRLGSWFHKHESRNGVLFIRMPNFDNIN